MKKILDYGYVDLVETWGSDQAIVEAARMSTSKGFKHWNDWTMCVKCGGRAGADVESSCEHEWKEEPGDEKLLRYLRKHHHDTPFEFAGMVVEVKAPIMVFREWHRHRSQGYNEASARYTPLPDENYVPTVERCLTTGGATRQAAAIPGVAALVESNALVWCSELVELYNHSERVYQSGLSRGVPKELARLAVTVGRYSTMRATTNLRMWLAFLTLRQAPDAQWEIRQYADAVGELIAEAFPRTWELFAGGSTS